MEEFLGIIKLFAGSFAPQGWAFCNGQVMQIHQNESLFRILGNRYGGDGKNTFALPDLRDCVAIGIGGQTVLGQKVGAAAVRLDQKNLPSAVGTATITNLNAKVKGTVAGNGTANIAIPCDSATAVSSAAGNFPGGDANTVAFSTGTPVNTMAPFNAPISINSNVDLPVTMNGAASVMVNLGQAIPDPVTLMQPSLGLNYIICVEGYYPQSS